MASAAATRASGRPLPRSRAQDGNIPSISIEIYACQRYLEARGRMLYERRGSARRHRIEKCVANAHPGH
eukprot:g4906.t1